MKKKSTSQSALARRSLSQGGFFNLRVIIGLCVALAGVFLALLGFGVFSAQAQQYNIATQSIDPLVPAGFDCSRIDELGIDKQENMRAQAIMIFCGRAQGGSASPFGHLLPDCPTAAASAPGLRRRRRQPGHRHRTFPNITQSETFTTVNPENPNQIVVAYNDSRGRNVSPINISGASVSTDGGTTFTRVTLASGQSPFSTPWATPLFSSTGQLTPGLPVWLDGACGGQGLGGYKSTTPWDATAGPINVSTPFPRRPRVWLGG